LSRVEVRQLEPDEAPARTAERRPSGELWPSAFYYRLL
jgi:hypothetical protein